MVKQRSLVRRLDTNFGAVANEPAQNPAVGAEVYRLDGGEDFASDVNRMD